MRVRAGELVIYGEGAPIVAQVQPIGCLLFRLRLPVGKVRRGQRVGRRPFVLEFRCGMGDELGQQNVHLLPLQVFDRDAAGSRVSRTITTLRADSSVRSKPGIYAALLS